MIFKESRPIYLQIADKMCDEILSGQYVEEGRIPSVREYAALVEVNPNTIVRTFEYLQTCDIIFNKRGMGYFVKEGAKENIRTMRKRDFLKVMLPDVFAEMKILNIGIDEVVDLYNKSNE